MGVAGGLIKVAGGRLLNWLFARCVEQLADNFAGAELMPADTLNRYGDWSNLPKQKLIKQLNKTANDLYVTASVLKWRLVAMNKIKQGVARSFPEGALHHNGHNKNNTDQDSIPALFSKPFMEVVKLALNKGLVSVRRLTDLLDVSVDDLSGLFAAHNIRINIK